MLTAAVSPAEMTHAAAASSRPLAVETMQALRAVLQEEETHAMEEVRRELERARMTAEDLRGAAFSPYGTNYTPACVFVTTPTGGI